MGALGEPGTSSDFDFTLSWDKFLGCTQGAPTVGVAGLVSVPPKQL